MLPGVSTEVVVLLVCFLFVSVALTTILMAALGLHLYREWRYQRWSRRLVQQIEEWRINEPRR